MGNALAEGLLNFIGCDLREIGKNDYLGEDGLWHCGMCKEPLQKKFTIPIAGLGERIVRVQCRCEKERFEEMDREKKMREEQEAISRLRGLSLMDEKFKDSTFSTFKTTKENARNLKLCKRYATAFETMKEKNQGLLFWGKPGTGKTYAAACIANYLLDHRQSVVMTSFVKLVSALQNPKGDETEENVINRLNRASLLIIDDLGAERSSDYVLERVYNIVDSRYRAKKPMLLTTNLSLLEMQQTTDLRYARIYDRVFEVCYPMEFTGDSWRFAEAARRYDEMQSLLEG